MKVSFQTTPPPLEDTDQFESVYPEGLQNELHCKAQVLSHGYHVWLRVDGKLAGEMYGIPAGEDNRKIPDTSSTDFYIGKFTILPEYQSRGLGKLLFAYTLAMLGSRFKRITWHASSEGMNLISDLFGAKSGRIHRDWGNTGRAAVFRYLEMQ